ncbi:MAG: hypothetical protein QXI48_08065 [Candidatus Bathyarchaeia archaeon]
MKRVILTIIMFSILLLTAYCSYNFGSTIGYKTGYKDGYEAGYTAGNETGYIYGSQTGFTRGYLIGFSRGNETGYFAGYLNGNETGYNLGYRIGFRDGEQRGYERGFSAGYELGYSNGFETGNATGFNLGYETGYLQGVIDGAGRGFTIRDPTYNEAMNFVKIDQTDKNEYVEGVYTCINFAADFKMNAFNAGYRCGLVYIEFIQGAHALVCFNTTDGGLIFIEPQTDDMMRVEIGIRYWNDNGYTCPWNDTIIRYIIIW